MTVRVSIFGCAMLLCAAGSAFAQAAEFGSCLSTLRSEALGRGISAQTFDSATKGLEPDPTVLEAMDAQPEFKTPIWDYLATLVDDQRIADGRENMQRWASVLEQAEAKFGVDRYVIAAVWGVESDFGRQLGGRPLVRSLATGACAGRRQKFFRDELMATLRILQSGDMPAEVLRGSWAGAFGQTQFMPTTYQRLAIDFDGDGKRDIVSSVPDALGSTANFLNKAGWVRGQPWGYEVRLPAGYSGISGRGNRQAVASPPEKQVLTRGPMPPEVAAALEKLAEAQANALESSKWVGNGFAELSRAMHYGERDAETIHGQATREEAIELFEEGIPVSPLPFPVAPPEELN